MAQAMVNFRMDADLKKAMEATCKEMGLTASAAYTLLAKKGCEGTAHPFCICGGSVL